MSLYQQLLLYSFIIPFIFSFYSKIRFDKFFFSVIISLIFSSVFFIIWDIYFTYLGVWGFNKEYNSGYMIINLPVEEVLFFFVIPFCCLFTYYVFKKFSILNIIVSDDLLRIIALIIFIIGCIFFNNIYTVTVFMISAGILFYASFNRDEWFGYFLGTYFIITFIPFVIVNGILTGVLDNSNPPVWYNINEIIGVRFITIPIEDIFYNFILLYTNFFLFEKINKKLIRN
tara:strand:- start:64 stop:750 length:687 start_codon:yes stop_codon:yes gene_type:complete